MCAARPHPEIDPDPLLWDRLPPTAPPSLPAGLVAGQPALPPGVAAELARITPAEILKTVQRYSGALPLDGTAAAKVDSRHIRHAGNGRAVDQMVADLEAAGQGRLQVRLHRFTHAGLALFNVEAGTGRRVARTRADHRPPGFDGGFPLALRPGHRPRSRGGRRRQRDGRRAHDRRAVRRSPRSHRRPGPSVSSSSTPRSRA